MATSVLHVCEAGGGGVLTALNGWIRSACDFEHTILISKRIDSFSELVWPDNVQMRIASDGYFSFANDYRKLLSQGNFDLIHFHSTKAGFLRIFKASSIVIYSPHCFAFERNGKKGALNLLIYFIEKILARRTGFFAAVSERERYLTLKLKPSARVNLVSFNVAKWKKSVPRNKIVAVGRICYQKDPYEFIKIIKLLRLQNPELEVVWIGDGDPNFKQSLIRNGVRVTGWIGPGDLLEELKDAAFLLHTARWEGMPMVFAEALAGGIPLVVRNSKYLEGDSILREIFVYETSLEALQVCESILINSYKGNSSDFYSDRIPYSLFLEDIIDE